MTTTRNAKLGRLAKASVLFVVMSAAGCFSWGNREGPDVTCTDLEAGKINACFEGIIARCVDAQVSYEVCEEGAACEAAWQQVGRFRCQTTDPLPEFDAGTGGLQNGSGGETTGTGGAKACGFEYSSSTCATCVEQRCCAESQNCASDSSCPDCATRTGAEVPCAGDMVPTYGAYVSCMASKCAGPCN